jgi:hypothetical protein
VSAAERETERACARAHVWVLCVCMYVCIHTHTHVQHGRTILWLACEKKDETVAAALMEETKRAGALDLQVTKKTGCVL